MAFPFSNTGKACALISSAVVFRCVLSARSVKYIPARMSICSTTAAEVTAIKIVSVSSMFVLARRRERHGMIPLQFGGCRFAFVSRGLAIGLASCLIRSPDLVFLRVQIIAAFVWPGSRLVFGLLRPVFTRVAALFGGFANLLAGFLAGLGRIQDSQRRPDAQPSQKPQDSAAILLCHNCLLQECSRVRMLALVLENYKPAAPLSQIKNALRTATCPV